MCRSATFTALFLILLTAGCSSGNEPVYVIIMGGQSNMVGQGRTSEIQPNSYGNINYLNYGLPSGIADSLRFGPEIGLSAKLAENYPDKHFLLVKYAIGGSSLLDWAPDYSEEKARITGNQRFGNMYDSLFTKIDTLIGNPRYQISAFLWMQGERDARIPEAGVDYYENFFKLIESVRRDTNVPDLPVLFGKVNPPAERYPALDTVNRAQEKFAMEDPNAWIIDTGDLEKWKDSLHYSSAGQIELGRRFGLKLSEILE